MPRSVMCATSPLRGPGSLALEFLDDSLDVSQLACGDVFAAGLLQPRHEAPGVAGIAVVSDGQDGPSDLVVSHNPRATTWLPRQAVGNGGSVLDERCGQVGLALMRQSGKRLAVHERARSSEHSRKMVRLETPRPHQGRCAPLADSERAPWGALSF